jgi:hypothetical protein
MPWLLVAALLSVLRFFVPTQAHSWPMVYVAVSHMFVGALLVLLWQKRGRWPLGWLCLGVPTLIETVLFCTGGHL